MDVSLGNLSETFLRYGLRMKDEKRKILVDLNAHNGRYELMRHRVDIEFDSVRAAKRGDVVVSQHAGLSFVAMVEYESSKVETIYSCDNEPPDAFYDALEPIAYECFFRANDDGRFLKNCLLPEEFLRLNISLRSLFESVTTKTEGKLIFVLNRDIDSDQLRRLANLGIEASVNGDMINIQVQKFEFEAVHRLLAGTFVALEGSTLEITGIEFDLRSQQS